MSIFKIVRSGQPDPDNQMNRQNRHSQFFSVPGAPMLRPALWIRLGHLGTLPGVPAGFQHHLAVKMRQTNLS